MNSYTGATAQDPMINDPTVEETVSSPAFYERKVAAPEQDAHDYDPNERVSFLGFRGVKLNIMIAICAGVGFVLFGYDQGVMGSLLTLPPFRYAFPQIDNITPAPGSDPRLRGDPSNSTLQGATIGIYEIGCFAGSVTCILWGNILGRRRMIWIGSLRGMLIMIEGSLISFGIMISYWVDFALYWAWKSDPGNPHESASWQVPIAFQILLILPTFLTIWMPESPRWLLLRGQQEEARRVLSALDDVSLGDPSIDTHIAEIKHSLSLSQSSKVMDMFKQGKNHNFHRVALAFVIQMFQQISGINLITYYAGTIFENSIGLKPVESRILAACNGTEYFLASIVAIFTVERIGRRKLMIWCALGMAGTMAILCGLLSHAALDMPTPEYDPSAARNKGPAIAACVFLFVFNSFFGIGWLGMTWLYPAECTPLSIRAQANGVSTSANWLFNFMVVMITPVAFSNINNYTYLIFAVINLLMAPASWWIFPETAGRSLEEMDDIFARSSVWNPYDAVRIEKQTPRRYDKFGNIKDALISETEQLEPVERFNEDYH
ncbi:hypothetical protein MBRA1_000326 [Malassezia brasiliensis]|uniref:Major facilitator superfamily (MFS) profile domain-containing protein n=1 Tax=Malassezia brasiliensis TaxID=1821822 RepID=A0AAF0IM52_9BASI|nr:hypothetical protein MBRA1_000326 [Malassezia brasiliensis]